MGRRLTTHRLLIAALAALFVAACPLLAAAQDATQGAAAKSAPTTAAPQPAQIADTPAPAQEQGFVTPVAVVNDSTDQLGVRLAFKLKEALARSPLFAVSVKDEKKLKIVLSTKPEFPGRPQVGSVYAAVWIYSAGEAVLTHYLASETGTVDAATVDTAAEALAARTAAAAEKYAYLFE